MMKLKEEIKMFYPNFDFSKIKLTKEDIAEFDKITENNEKDTQQIFKEYLGRKYDLLNDKTSLDQKIQNFSKEMEEADKKIENLIETGECDPEVEEYLTKIDASTEYQIEVTEK